MIIMVGYLTLAVAGKNSYGIDPIITANKPKWEPTCFIRVLFVIRNRF